MQLPWCNQSPEISNFRYGEEEEKEEEEERETETERGAEYEIKNKVRSASMIY